MTTRGYVLWAVYVIALTELIGAAVTNRPVFAVLLLVAMAWLSREIRFVEWTASVHRLRASEVRR